jgi:hypothetical protein
LNRSASKHRLKIRTRITIYRGMCADEILGPINRLTDAECPRDALLRASGIDPEAIVWSRSAVVGDVSLQSERGLVVCTLEDGEWSEIAGTGIFPQEPTQASAMSNRDLLAAVITIVGQSRAWTELDLLGISSEAVRKKFSRLARKGVWQALAISADKLELSAARRAALKAIGFKSSHMLRR